MLYGPKPCPLMVNLRVEVYIIAVKGGLQPLQFRLRTVSCNQSKRRRRRRRSSDLFPVHVAQLNIQMKLSTSQPKIYLVTARVAYRLLYPSYIIIIYCFIWIFFPFSAFLPFRNLTMCPQQELVCHFFVDLITLIYIIVY